MKLTNKKLAAIAIEHISEIRDIAELHQPLSEETSMFWAGVGLALATEGMLPGERFQRILSELPLSLLSTNASD